MLLDRAPAWDKHRTTSFFVGLFSSLLLSHIVLHIETDRPHFDPKIEKVYEDEIIQIPPRTVHKKQKSPIPPPTIEKIHINPELINEIELVDDYDESALDTTTYNTDPEEITAYESAVVEAPPKVEPLTMSEPEDKDNEPLVFAQRMPIFGSCADETTTYAENKLCSDTQLLAYMYKHIRYPAQARELGIEGTVVAEFIVEKDGSTTSISILRSLSGSCDREVLDVIGTLPKWLPGKQNGRPVRILFRVPVKFRLQ